MNELDFHAFVQEQEDLLLAMFDGRLEEKTFLLSPGFWEEYDAREETRSRRADARVNSELFDRIIGDLRYSIGYAESALGLEATVVLDRYVEAVELLSLFNRRMRCEVSCRLKEKRLLAESRAFSFFWTKVPEFDFAAVFMASDELDRDRRRDVLGALVAEAASRVSLSRIVGVATEGNGTGTNGMSLDIVVGDTHAHAQQPRPSEIARVFGDS
jgi:hypothetical protein